MAHPGPSLNAPLTVCEVSSGGDNVQSVYVKTKWTRCVVKLQQTVSLMLLDIVAANASLDNVFPR